MIPPVLLFIYIRTKGRHIPIPIPVVLLWPLLLVALLAYGTKLHALARLLVAARGLRVEVTERSGDAVRILLI